MAQNIEKIVDFFKKIFGDDFKLNGLSTEEGKIEYILSLLLILPKLLTSYKPSKPTTSFHISSSFMFNFF